MSFSGYPWSDLQRRRLHRVLPQDFTILETIGSETVTRTLWQFVKPATVLEGEGHCGQQAGEDGDMWTEMFSRYNSRDIQQPVDGVVNMNLKPPWKSELSPGLFWLLV